MTEGIIDATEICIGMVSALMVEGMPLTSTNELASPTIHHGIGIGQRERRRELSLLSPTACSTVDGVMCIPIIDIFAPLTGEDAFVYIIFPLAYVIGPIIKHIVVFLYPLGVKVGSSYGAALKGVFLTGYLQGFKSEVRGIARFIENRFPHEHTRMIAVTTDDVAGVLMYHLTPLRVFVPILPARGGYDNEESQLVAGIHERWILRIVCSTDDGHARLFQSLGITPMLAVWHSITNVGKVLMAIASDELMVGVTIKPESILSPELCLTDSGTKHAAIHSLTPPEHLDLHLIEIRIFWRPKVRGGD